MVYVRVENNRIVDIYTVPEGFTIDECHHPDIVKQFIDVSNCSPIPNVGWNAVFNGETWAFSIPSLPEEIPYRKSLEERVSELEQRISLLESSK